MPLLHGGNFGGQVVSLSDCSLAVGHTGEDQSEGFCHAVVQSADAFCATHSKEQISMDD